VRYARRVFVTRGVHGCGCAISSFDALGGAGIDAARLVSAASRAVLGRGVCGAYTCSRIGADLLATCTSSTRSRMRRYLWAFAIANFISFVVWMAFPAAPPWYVRAHGLSGEHERFAERGGLLRVDQLFGMHYYQSLYSRAASVFGAMPACTALTRCSACSRRGARSAGRRGPIHIVYAITMFVGSNYLDHHWLWDGIAVWRWRASPFWLSENCSAKVDVKPARRACSWRRRERAGARAGHASRAVVYFLMDRTAGCSRSGAARGRGRYRPCSPTARSRASSRSCCRSRRPAWLRWVARCRIELRACVFWAS